MADTLPLSSGTFVLPTINKTLSSTTSELGVTTVSATNPGGQSGTLNNLNYVTTDPAIGANLEVTAATNLVVNNSSFTFAAADDTLVIASAKTNTNNGSQFVATNSSFDLGSGNNTLIFSDAVRNVSIISGSGDDIIEIKGDIQSSTINAGAGADTLIFGGNIKAGTTVNLGSDNSIDTIRIAAGHQFNGLSITGASNGDLLIIGTSQYTFNQADNTWNGTNPNDKLKF